jgi:hypothetical protein
MNRIFISYAREDRSAAENLYEELKGNKLSPWIDVVDLRPGQEWQVEIEKAIKCSAIFLACLSEHAVSKRSFVQSELNSALKILDMMPEGKVYLIPVRLGPCEVPSKLEHLQWVDYFEDGGPAKLVDALRAYLGHSSGEQKTGMATGPLKFASIRIDASDPSWEESARFTDSPFAYPCSRYFKIGLWVCDADPVFDITLMNTIKSPVILTAIGVEVVTVGYIDYVSGVPSAAKIPKSDAYVIEIPNIWQLIGVERRWQLEKPREVTETVRKQLTDPVYLESGAPYRYGLLLKNYYNHVPNFARIRMHVTSDQGECVSEELETFTH